MTPNTLRLQRARSIYASAQAIARQLKQGHATDREANAAPRRYLRLRLATGLALDRSEYVRNLLKLGSVSEGDRWLAEALTPKVGETWEAHRETRLVVETPEGWDAAICIGTPERDTLELHSWESLLQTVCIDASWAIDRARSEREREREAAEKAALPLERYLSTLPPMRAGKVRKSLTGCKTLTRLLRHVWAEKYYATVRTDGDRVYTEDSEWYLLRGDVTKAALDYVSWLKWGETFETMEAAREYGLDNFPMFRTVRTGNRWRVSQ